MGARIEMSLLGNYKSYEIKHIQNDESNLTHSITGKIKWQIMI
jgi:hypothetical protein